MNRHQEALDYLASWDPAADELPDWIADALDDDPALSAVFDAQFTPWEAGDLGGSPTRAPANRRPWVLMGSVGLLAAAASALFFAGVGTSMAPEVQSMPSPLVQADPGPVPSDGNDIGRFGPDVGGKAQGNLPLDDRHTAEAGERVAAEPTFLPLGDPGTEVATSEVRTTVTGSTSSTPVSGLRGEVAAPSDANGIVADPGNRNVIVDSTSRGQVLTKDFLQRVPAGRSYQSAVSVTPGVQVSDKEGVKRRKRTSDPTLEVDAFVTSGAIDRGEVIPDPAVASVDLDQIGSTEGEHRNYWVEPVVPMEPPGTEDYTDYGHHSFVRTRDDPQSTFGADVDTASLTMSRRKLVDGYLPPTASIRVEEFVNYLPYDYAAPRDGSPFAVDFEATPNPFNPRTHLVRIGIQGRRVGVDQRKPVHLTFLVDTSGSMQSNDKMGLVKHALTALTQELRDGDTIALVAYAGSAGVILEPTPMSRRSEVLRALDRMTAGGSTAMGAGIDLAYALADRTFHDGAVNRVIVLSDGDANVGATHHEVMLETIRTYAAKGITLTTAGFGQGNYNDTMMENLANKGDGNYFFIDSMDEARRVFVDKLTSTLVVIAKDVKLQVEWDADRVEAYRLVGYENRDIADRDFRNDAVDAGEIGAGHQVTALYEVALAPGARGNLATVRVRNKAPGPESPAVERSFSLDHEVVRDRFDDGDRDFRMAVAAASFAELLRGNPHLHGASYADVAGMARRAQRAEYREDGELITMIERAGQLSSR